MKIENTNKKQLKKKKVQGYISKVCQPIWLHSTPHVMKYLPEMTLSEFNHHISVKKIEFFIIINMIIKVFDHYIKI